MVRVVQPPRVLGQPNQTRTPTSAAVTAQPSTPRARSRRVSGARPAPDDPASRRSPGTRPRPGTPRRRRGADVLPAPAAAARRARMVRPGQPAMTTATPLTSAAFTAPVTERVTLPPPWGTVPVRWLIEAPVEPSAGSVFSRSIAIVWPWQPAATSFRVTWLTV